ncbi:MAG: hypothetical protein K2X00_16895 [Nitrospiraceae bacterium]|nr:hypothetical protein [Nitrospiraceae bacterium]
MAMSDHEAIQTDSIDPFELPDLPLTAPISETFERATRSAFVTVRTLPSEKVRLRAAAKRAGYRDVSSWARGVLLAAAAGEHAPRLDDAAATEIARLRRDLNSGLGANLNQAMTHANTNARAGITIDEAGLSDAVNAAQHAVEMLRADLQAILKPHGRP